MHNCQDPHLLGWQKLKLTDKLLQQVVLGCFTRLGLEQIQVALLALARSPIIIYETRFQPGVVECGEGKINKQGIKRMNGERLR